VNYQEKGDEFEKPELIAQQFEIIEQIYMNQRK